MTDVPPTPIDRSVEGRSATPLVIGMLLVALGVVAYFAFGMPGMDHSAPSTDSAMSSHNSHRSVDPAAFKAAMVDDDTVTINVHVPASAVKLDGTELVLPFDDLDTGQLPENRATPLAVYCRSGSMSAIAAQHLLEMGYTNIVELDGGTNEWVASGRSITDRAND